MKLIYFGVDKFQPSSTRFRCTFEVLDEEYVRKYLHDLKICDIDKSDKTFLHCHSSDIVDKNSYVELIRIFLEGKIRLYSIAEEELIWIGYPDSPSQQMEDLFVDYSIRKIGVSRIDKIHIPIMIIVDIGFCHINCPWCYAKNKIIIDEIEQSSQDLPELDDLVDKVRELCFSVSEEVAKRFRDKLCGIDINLTFGGNGDISIIEPWNIKYVIKRLTNIEYEIEKRIEGYFKDSEETPYVYVWISVSTSDPFRFVNEFKHVIPNLDIVSITYIPKELRKIVGNKKLMYFKEEDYGKVINEICNNGVDVDLQFILTRDINYELERVFDEVSVKNLIYNITLFPLHFYDTGFRHEIFLTTRDEVIRELTSIMEDYPVDKISRGLIKLDVCTVKKLLGINICNEVLRNKLIWRITYDKKLNEWTIQPVTTCPMGGICKI